MVRGNSVLPLRNSSWRLDGLAGRAVADPDDVTVRDVVTSERDVTGAADVALSGWPFLKDDAVTPLAAHESVMAENQTLNSTAHRNALLTNKIVHTEFIAALEAEFAETRSELVQACPRKVGPLLFDPVPARWRGEGGPVWVGGGGSSATTTTTRTRLHKLRKPSSLFFVFKF